MSALRSGLTCALVWRALTELLRRCHASHHWALRQIHPGSSIAGLFELQLTPRHSKAACQPPPALLLHLGGVAPPAWSLGILAEPYSLLPLLGREPERVIDAIAHALQLPPPPLGLSASSADIVAMRLLAGVLEARALSPRNWRITLGLIGCSEDIVCQWHVAAAALEGAPLCVADRQRLWSLALLHRTDAAGSVQQGLLEPGQAALLVDLNAGTAQILRGSQAGEAVDLAAMYQAGGRQMAALVRHWDAQLD